MATIVLVIHLLIAIAMVTVVLMQRSEGGALGIGGGGGGSGGGFLTGRGTANLLTRTTAFLAMAFFVTSITLSLLAQSPTNQGSILDNVPAQQQNQPTGTPQLGPDGLAPLPSIPQGR